MIIEYSKSYEDVKNMKEKNDDTKSVDFMHKAPKSNCCNNCGLKHAKNRCPAYGKTCLNCGKYNHFSSCCQSNRQNQNIRKSNNFRHKKQNGRTQHASRYRGRQNEIVHDSAENSENYDYSDEEDVGFIGKCLASTRKEDWCVNVNLDNNRKVSMKIDTGADVTVINSKTYEMMKNKPPLVQPDKKLRSPGGSIRLNGMFTGKVSYKNNSVNGNIYVLTKDNKCGNLLSRDMSVKLGIVSFIGVAAEKEELFGFGKWNTKPVDLQMKDENVQPYAVNTARKVPLPIRPAVKSTLKKMEDEGIIKKVTNPTEWVSPMVPVAKKGSDKVRITVDYRKLNVNLVREVFPIPTFEELSSKLSNATHFSKLDASSGFYQIPLSESSQDLTTFITPFGRYKFLRLPMGINIAPEVYQRKMMELTENMEGVICYLDDLVVFGCTKEEHDARLAILLDKLMKEGLRLNRDKCSFGVEKISFLGHMITKEGIQVDPEKVQAIGNMKAPKNKKELQSLLGMINFLMKFVPRCQEILGPMNDLLKNDTAWLWGPAQEKSLQSIKKLLTQTPVLAFYDANRETVLSVDASSYGLGGVLMQRHGTLLKPVAYCSRTLSKSEKNWAQIEKELLAAVFASEKFHIFLCGLEYTLESDHKPLIPLINKKDLPDAPIRCQRLLMRLARYTVRATYVPGKYLVVADTLSRLQPCNSSNIDISVSSLDDDVSAYVDRAIANIQASASTLQRLKRAQLDDSSIANAMHCTKTSWENTTDEDSAYFEVQGDLSLSNEGLLLYRDRIVVPGPMQEEMLRKVHGNAHLSLTKCRERIKMTIWWKGISTAIDNWIKNCNFCQVNRRRQRAEPLRPSPLPDRPWQKIAMDLLEFQGKMYLVTIDQYSRWIELDHLPTTTSTAVIKKLDIMFSRFGQPEYIRSDGGPQFSSHEFALFCQKNDIQHSMSAPHYPQGNGAAERAVQTAKRILKTDNPVEALKDYRSTPLLTTGYAPCQLLMGRMIRTKLPMSNAILNPQWPPAEEVKKRDDAAKEKYATDFNRRHGARKLPNIPSGAMVRERKPGDKTWSDPMATAQLSRSKYVVRNRKHLQFCPTAARMFTTTTTVPYAPPSQPARRREVTPEPSANSIPSLRPPTRPCESQAARRREVTPEPSASSMPTHRAPISPNAPAGFSQTDTGLTPQHSTPCSITRYGRTVKPVDRYGCTEFYSP